MVGRLEQSLLADLPGAGSIPPTPGCSLLPGSSSLSRDSLQASSPGSARHQGLRALTFPRQGFSISSVLSSAQLNCRWAHSKSRHCSHCTLGGVEHRCHPTQPTCLPLAPGRGCEPGDPESAGCPLGQYLCCHIPQSLLSHLGLPVRGTQCHVSRCPVGSSRV